MASGVSEESLVSCDCFWLGILAGILLGLLALLIVYVLSSRGRNSREKLQDGAPEISESGQAATDQTNARRDGQKESS